MTLPFIDDDDIYHRADIFLHEYHPTYLCPIPIEEIAEVKLGLFILPVKNLETKCEIDGSISRDFKTILIDEKVYLHQDDRARFTLAHEVGHYVLHKSLFEKNHSIITIEDFVDFQNSLSYKDWQRIEIQAYRFAEEILFPKAVFREVVEQEIKRLGGLNKLTVTDLSTLGEKIKKAFHVSNGASYSKLRREFPLIIEKAQSNIPF